jgi:hypothetical protein
MAVRHRAAVRLPNGDGEGVKLIEEGGVCG